MIVSNHRLTGYWLSDRNVDGHDRAKNFLALIRPGQEGHIRPKGYIYKYYNPQELDSAPGYDWLRDRLGEFTKPSEFDADPELVREPQFRDRDPFPAFFWEIEPSDEGGLAALVEVLVGKDIVVFHQCALQYVESKEFQELVKRLEQTPWVALHDSPGALFTAKFTYVSDFGSPENTFRSDWLGESTSPSFSFYPGKIEYTLRLDLERVAELNPTPAFEGRVLVESVRGGEGKNHSKLHLDACGFSVRFATLLVNLCKVEFEGREADLALPKLGKALDTCLSELQKRQQERTWMLPAPLTRVEIEELQRFHLAAGKIIQQAGQLVDTCIRNTNQFANLSKQLLHALDPWAQRTLIQLRERNDQLAEAHRSLDNKAKWLWADIQFALATGRLLASETIPELIQFQPSRQPPTVGGFPSLVVVGSEPAEPQTLWYTTEAPSSSNTKAWALVRRPDVLQPDQRDDLTNFYLRSLRDCSIDDLGTLIDRLSSPGAILRLTLRDEKSQEHVAIGRIFNLQLRDRWADLRSLEIRDIVDKFLPESGGNRFSEVYDKKGWTRFSQDWLGFVSLLSFLEAVVRVFEDPPDHLAKATRDHAAERSQFLLLLGLLHGVARQFDTAQDYCFQSARAALANKDLAWSYFAAQIFRRCEQLSEAQNRKSNNTTASRPKSQKQPWQSLALDFLKAYDIRSAVGLARSTPHATFRRPREIRVLLWGLALLVGATLLAADAWLPSARAWGETWREGILISVSALAVLGAPLALGIGARGALKPLYPDILYPRILGAIVLAAINFCATQETGTLASAKLEIFGLLVVLCLGGGGLYLFFDVKKKVGQFRESLTRCLDIFSLSFLGAASLSTIFALVYESMFCDFAKLSARAEVCPDFYSIGEIFLRPRTIFLVALLSMLIGIVVQLMFQSTDKPTKDDL